MANPLIGITLTRRQNQSGIPVLEIQEAYTRAIASAGGAPLLIPSGLPQPAVAALAARLDGILFSGGGDIDPRWYGSQPHPLVNEMDDSRDYLEVQLIRDSLQAGLPILGICRGLQVINVALGGSLYEDILDQHPNAMRHQYGSLFPRHHLAHSITVEKGSRLAEILGESMARVNSLHHQGIRCLAPGVIASAFAPDGIVEAIELPDQRFAMAVQWHPEWMLEKTGMQALFQAFVEAAAECGSERGRSQREQE